jgi:hypothetical protein
MDSIKLFPNPPKHYTLFSSEEALLPPDLSNLNKINSFMTFGAEYKMKELNFPTLTVESEFLKFYDPEIINKKQVPNRQLDFSVPPMENFNLFEAISQELKFIKKSYKEILDNLTTLEDFELNSCLIKYSFQKIYFFLSHLKKKKVLNFQINLGRSSLIWLIISKQR